MDKWRDKTAVVTGSSSGIGAAILKELVREGVNVVGLARNTEKFLPIIDEMRKSPGKIQVHQCDVSESESVREAFQWIDDQFGCVDILINCAGIFRFITILNGDDKLNADLRETMDVNFMGSVYCAREAYKSMSKHGNYGIIININSVGGHYVSERRHF
jgi:NADP+-dependent farnesol dehydrogenase